MDETKFLLLNIAIVTLLFLFAVILSGKLTELKILFLYLYKKFLLIFKSKKHGKRK